MNDEDDVVSIGKLRRRGLPGAAVSYDPRYGIRVDGEDAPADPEKAAAWCRASGGWVRIFGRAKNSGRVAVDSFIRAWRRR